MFGISELCSGEMPYFGANAPFWGLLYNQLCNPKLVGLLHLSFSTEAYGNSLDGTPPRKCQSFVDENSNEPAAKNALI
jgi:hypothetical protein